MLLLKCAIAKGTKMWRDKKRKLFTHVDYRKLLQYQHKMQLNRGMLARLFGSKCKKEKPQRNQNLAHPSRLPECAIKKNSDQVITLSYVMDRLRTLTFINYREVHRFYDPKSSSTNAVVMLYYTVGYFQIYFPNFLTNSNISISSDLCGTRSLELKIVLETGFQDTSDSNWSLKGHQINCK